MEHEVEKTIRRKVAEAEATPVSWRKDRVWERIDLSRKRTPRITFYYAAAAFIVTGFTLFYLLQQSQHSTTQDRINALESALAKKMKTEDHLDVKASNHACVDVQLETAKAFRKSGLSVRLENKSLSEPQIILPKLETTPEVAIAAVEIDMKDQPSVDINKEAPAEIPLVKPIIGYIPTPSNASIVSKKYKKTKIRFLKAPEPELATQTTERNWISARIN